MYKGKRRIGLALSGGIDSTMAGWLLKQKGYDIKGIYLHMTDGNGPQMAQKVADFLKIPLMIIDIRDYFREKIIKHFIKEYLSGRTPNPCVRCNAIIKCDTLLKICGEKGLESFATGHYARIIKDKKRYLLLKGIDVKKDQSYFLYRLTQRHLSSLRFPLGDLTKAEVMSLGRDNQIAADIEESQEICFLASTDYRLFLRQEARDAFQPGQIVDKQGIVLGIHYGLPYYTIGQRKGLDLRLPGPFYVIRIDKERNRLVVGREEELYSESLIAVKIHRIIKEWPGKVHAQIRSTQPAQEADIVEMGDNKIKVYFKKPVKAISPGQSVVFYQGDVCLGGGIISD